MINQQLKEIPNPREVYEANHAARKAAPKFEYIHQEDIGGGVFDIIKLKDHRLLFSFQDKHGIFNVFPTMSDYTMYAEGDLDGCTSVCINDESLDESDPAYEEGVDALDRYLGAL